MPVLKKDCMAKSSQLAAGCQFSKQGGESGIFFKKTLMRLAFFGKEAKIGRPSFLSF